MSKTAYNLTPSVVVALGANLNDWGTDNRAVVPEYWVAESLRVLEENLVYANLVHRDFENVIASSGDIINTRRPGTFTAARKIDGDDVLDQPATAEKVQVPLDQHFHTSFLIHDVESSKSFLDLRDMFLVPAIRSIAEQIDSLIDAQKYEFLANTIGRLGTALTRSSVIDTQVKASQLLWPNEGRWGVLTPEQKGQFLDETQFTDADRFGDDGTAIREGSIGRLYGTNWLESNNNKTIVNAEPVVEGAVNEADGYVAGDTTMTVDGLTAAIAAGTWFTVAGDDTPQVVISTVGGGTPTSITFAPGLARAVADDAVVTLISPAAINEGDGYASGYNKLITVDGLTTGTVAGQLVSTTPASGLTWDTIKKYGALPLPPTTAGAATSRQTNLYTNRSLDTAVADDDVLGVGPGGNFGFVFHRDAIALVNRPLALPPAGAGVLAAVMNNGQISMRVSIGYDHKKQALRVTIDTLVGVKTLNTQLGITLLS